MELICPSCEARYQVPDASIGEKGRQVSCMNCGHSWHAFPPLVLGSGAAPPTTASSGIDWQSPARPGRPSSGLIFPEPEAPARPAPRPQPGTDPVSDDAGSELRPSRPAAGSRSEQLAEIREMLAEVQSEERAAAALTPDAAGSASDADADMAPIAPPREAARAAALAPLPPLPSRDDIAAEDEDEGSDPLRRRMAMHDAQTGVRPTDIKKLRRRHDRKARRQKHAQEAGSGAFLTGFLLVVIIGAGMTALYLLHPQIVARMPASEPMMTEYVQTIDDLRTNVAEGFSTVRGWAQEMIEKAR